MAEAIGFNLLTGIVFGIAGWFIGYVIGDHIHGANLAYYSETGGTERRGDHARLLLRGGRIPGRARLRQLPAQADARTPAHASRAREVEAYGPPDTSALSTDHKVVANQYMVGIGLFFFVGGLNAMLIRTELLQPNTHVFGANQYLTLVGMHGSMMMGIMTSAILGPFANWLVPLMIGSRRMAFPRIESLTFWLLMAGAVVLLTTIFFGGFQTGWTGYQPLGDQNTAGYDAYIGFFALVGLSMCLLGFNLIATIITMRAPGMTWSRLPIFVWACLPPPL